MFADELHDELSRIQRRLQEAGFEGIVAVRLASQDDGNRLTAMLTRDLDPAIRAEKPEGYRGPTWVCDFAGIQFHAPIA